MSVRVGGGPIWTSSTPAKLFSFFYEDTEGQLGQGRTYDVAPDGRRFLMIKDANVVEGPTIVVVQNWLEELKRLVPVN